MITTNNIRAYINFLHLKKYSAPATEDLKNRWATVPDYELHSQLQGLYQHWGIDTATAAMYEQLFLSTAQQPPVMPAAQQTYGQPQQQPQYQQPLAPVSPQKSSKAPLIIGILVGVLALGGGLAYYLLSDKSHGDSRPMIASDTTAEVTPTPKVEQSATAPIEEIPETPTVTSGDMDEHDGTNVAVIENLLHAEESRDMGSILRNFSTDAQQYWDISYPTQNELRTRYSDVWKKSENGKHNNIRIEKVSNNTYDMYADYQFFSVKEGVTKALAVHVRYVFDDEHKIIKTYGVK